MSDRSRAVFFVLVGLLGACGGGSESSTSPTSETRASQQPITTAVAPSPSSAAGLTYLAFGDSWPYGAHCNGCRPFPVLLQAGFAAVTGETIFFRNLVSDGGTAEGLANQIKSLEAIRKHIATADIIVIAIGGNDLEPAFEASAAGTCGGSDGLDCFRAVGETLRAAYDLILTEIGGLRAGRPTAVRLVTGSNEFLSDADLIEILGAEFGATKGVAITAMYHDMQCEVAADHHAICVDLGHALNGPDLLTPNDVNTQATMQAVADAILATGLEELAR